MCSFCNSELSRLEAENVRVHDSNLWENSNIYLRTNVLSKEQTKHLEIQTKNPSVSQVWMAKKKTKTFNKFTRHPVKPQNIINNLLEMLLNYNTTKNWNKLHQQLTKHKVKCSRSNLVIHCEFPYSAESPDGLIGESGIIEVKSLCSAKKKQLRKQIYSI